MTLKDDVRDERTELLGALESLRPDQWARSSLCTEWTVCDVVAHLDARRLGRNAGHLSPEEMWGVDEALMTVLGIV